MLIINADDFGRTRQSTNRIVSCHNQGRVTSTSAMVFMEDSQRAAELAGESNIDVGLHLNFTQKPTQPQTQSSLFCAYHDRIAAFLTRRKYNFLIYNPALRRQFEYVFQLQLEEFERLYSMSPSHIDGHHHMHLCTNMLIKTIIPKRQRVRRNFSFARGEKNLLNRIYRRIIDKGLERKYLIADYFFSLADVVKTDQIKRVLNLAKTAIVELETHPELDEEFEWLMGDAFFQTFSGVKTITHSQLEESIHPRGESSK